MMDAPLRAETAKLEIVRVAEVAEVDENYFRRKKFCPAAPIRANSC